MKIDTPELKRLRTLVVDLNVQWQMFEELFLDDTNYSVFNRTGPNFWIHLQVYLFETVLLSISRFFDPAATGAQSNLSLAAIIRLTEVDSIRSDLERRLAELKPVWERGAKLWRHKKISHSDMPTMLGSAPLPEIPYSEVRTLVSGVSELVREIDHQLNQVDTSYRISVSQWVPQVLRYLNEGIRKVDGDRARG